MSNAILISALLLSMPATGSEYQRAGRYLGKALYKEYRIDKYVRTLEKKYIPEEVREYAPLVTISRIAIEKRIEFEWRF